MKQNEDDRSVLQKAKSRGGSLVTTCLRVQLGELETPPLMRLRRKTNFP